MSLQVSTIIFPCLMGKNGGGHLRFFRAFVVIARSHDGIFIVENITDPLPTHTLFSYKMTDSISPRILESTTHTLSNAQAPCHPPPPTYIYKVRVHCTNNLYSCTILYSTTLEEPNPSDWDDFKARLGHM